MSVHRPRAEGGQALPLALGAVSAALVGALVLGSMSGALAAKGRHQRAADLAAVSAAAAMREAYPRLFEPAWLGPGVRNPRHLEPVAYLALARGAALRAARRDGVPLGRGAVRFTGGGPAPTRVEVRVEGEAPVPDALGRARRPGGATGRHRARDSRTPAFGGRR